MSKGLRKPKVAVGTGKNSGHAHLLVAGAALVCAVAVAYLRTSAPPLAPPAVHRGGGASERLAAPSPSEEPVADACDSIWPLFAALDGAAEGSCRAFLGDFWERAPLLSRPGAAWNRELMTLGDIGRMVGSWPIRFFKNHAKTKKAKL